MRHYALCALVALAALAGCKKSAEENTQVEQRYADVVACSYFNWDGTTPGAYVYLIDNTKNLVGNVAKIGHFTRAEVFTETEHQRPEGKYFLMDNQEHLMPGNATIWDTISNEAIVDGYIYFGENVIEVEGRLEYSGTAVAIRFDGYMLEIPNVIEED